MQTTVEGSKLALLTADGASAAVHSLLGSMIQDTSDAFLVPVPQYPLYSSALALYGGTLIPYYLDEASNWGVDVSAVEQIIRSSQAKGLRVRGMVVIHPGNPTGQVLSQYNQVCTYVFKFSALAVLKGAYVERRAAVKRNCHDVPYQSGASIPCLSSSTTNESNVQRKILKLCATMGVPIIADEVRPSSLCSCDVVSIIAPQMQQGTCLLIQTFSHTGVPRQRVGERQNLHLVPQDCFG